MEPDSSAPPPRTVSVWDLDGTVLSTDVFVESVLRVLTRAPWLLPHVVLWLLRGRSYCKGRVAELTIDSWVDWPVRPEVVTAIESARADGRPVLLATAAHHRAASRVARDTGLFDDVIASTDDVNLKGETKRLAIREWVDRSGCAGYSYAGDSHADLRVWADADAVIVVNPTRDLERRIDSLGKPVTVLGKRRDTVRSVIRALRPHQWTKNALLFVPMVLAHTIDLQRIVNVLLALVAFSASASAVYVLNDLADLPSDRVHPKKQQRPFASGHLGITTGVGLIAGLLALSLAIAVTFLPASFTLILVGYFLANILYSHVFKQRALIDVMVLAGMYIIRVEAGAVAATTPISDWLLIFSFFFFTSLAFSKRYTELRRAAASGLARLAGRGYRTADLPFVEALGTASGFVSVLVLALYMESDPMRRIYGESRLPWLICPLFLYWITRVWLLTHRGELDEDPVVFALHDRLSFVIVLISVVLIMVPTLTKWMVIP